MNVVREIGLKTGGYDSLVVDNTAGGIGFATTDIRPTSGDFSDLACQIVEVSVENNSIRYTKDGTIPIAGVASAVTHGTLVAKGGSFILDHPSDVSNFLAIAVDSDAWLRCNFKFF